MKNSAPSSLGIIAIAALFGLIALIVAYALLHFAGMASFVIGLIVAIITAIVLWMGWGGENAEADTPTAHGTSSGTSISEPSPTATPTAASSASVNPVTTSSATATPTAVTAAPSAKAAEPEVKTDTPAAKTDAPAKMSATPPADKAADKPKAAVKPKAAAKSATKSSTKAAAKPKAAKSADKAAAKPAAKAAAPKRAPVAADGKPETLSKARAGGADDLKLLKGVGPGLEKTLNELGFFHFDQVGGWRKKEVEWVDSRLKFKGRIERDEWIKQAKVLAKGGETEFSKRKKK